MLEAKDLTFSVGDRELVSAASAAFEPGKLHLIIGPNGGRIVAKGVPNDVLTGERIRNVFGVEPIMVPVENYGVHIVFD